MLAYATLCRSLVEYASSVWDPVLEYQIYGIEMVQHRAVRFICDLKGRVSISAAIDTLESGNLSERRKKIDAISLQFCLMKSAMRPCHTYMANL